MFESLHSDQPQTPDFLRKSGVFAFPGQIQNAIFTKLGYTGTIQAGNLVRDTTGVAHDANDYLIYETDTGKLFYDSNGSAAGGSTLIATFTNRPALTASDFYII